MRPKLFGFTSLLMLAAMIYSSVGPQVCRAVMASQIADATIKCCGDGSNPTKTSDSPSGDHESCPLHRLSLIELLPAQAETRIPEAPSMKTLDSSAIVPAHAAFDCASELPLACNDSSPPSSPSRSLFLVHRNIRR